MRTIGGAAGAAALVLLAGCAGARLDIPEFQARVAGGDYGGALGALDAAGTEGDVADLLDRALLLSSLGRYAESNAVFDEAELRIDDLYTRSLGREALSLLTNDRSLDYRPPAHEHAAIAYFRAWNYIEAGNSEGAIVEARKIGERLTFRADACPEAEGACGHDLFLRCFSGLVFEWGGELNDAYVAYKQADLARETARRAFAVDPPPDLGRRLVRLARQLGFRDEAERYAGTYGIDPDALAGPDPGRVVVILENGMVGHRVEESLTVPIFKGEREQIAGDVDGWSRRLSERARATPERSEFEYLLRIALPRFVEHSPAGREAVFTLGPAGDGVTRPVERFSAMGARALDDAMGGILVRSIARALTKYLAKEAADKELGQGAGLLVNLLGAVTESADTRSWRSLPHEIQMTVLEAPAGTYEGRLVVRGSAGETLVERAYPGLEVKPGGVAFVRHRSGM